MNIQVWKRDNVTETTIMVDNEDLIGSYDFKQAQEQIRLLNSLKYKGFNDWRLPTKEELNELYFKRNIIGGFASAYYWSSSEYDNSFAWKQNFTNGVQNYTSKYTTSYVRAVRNI